MTTESLTMQTLTAFKLEPAEKIKRKHTQRMAAIPGRVTRNSYPHKKLLPPSVSTIISLSQYGSMPGMSTQQTKTIVNHAKISQRVAPKNKLKSTEFGSHKLPGMNCTQSENCRLCGSSKMYFRSTKILRAFPSVMPIILGHSELAPRP